MSGVLFEKFPKLYRLKGPVVVSEKIDGTNACIIVDENGDVYAQSRTQLITPEKDNFGFARWVYENKEEITEVLGAGRHYGEWWGKGIQRGYNMPNKVFSLFNTSLWDAKTLYNTTSLNIDVVPVLFTGTFIQVIEKLPELMLNLKLFGSVASPGYMNAEGVVVYDTQSGTGFKRTFEYDLTGKMSLRDEHGNVI